MDRKRLIQILLMIGILAAWTFIFPKFFGSKTPDATSTGKLVNVGVAPQPASAPATAASTMPEQNPVQGFPAPQQWTLGSSLDTKKANFEIVINNVQAGIESATLSTYTTATKNGKPEPILAAGEHGYRAFATTRVVVGTDAYDMLVRPDGQALTWNIDERQSNANRVTLYIIFYDPANPTKERLRIYKTFEITKDSYLVNVSYLLVNKTAAPLPVTIDSFGPTSLANQPPDDFRMDTRTYQTGTYNRTHQDISGNAKMVRQPTLSVAGAKDQPLGSFSYDGTDERLVWVAASKRFFTVIALPQGTDTTDKDAGGVPIPNCDFISGATASAFYIADKDKPQDSVSGIQFTGQPVTVAANGSATLPMQVYIGPKQLTAFEGDPAAPVGTLAHTAAIYKFADLINFSQGGFCGFLTFPIIAKAILGMLNGLHVLIPNYGLSIIILVIVIRLCLHPLTRRAQKSMAVMQRKMAKAQPELDRIKKKYAKDPGTQRTEQMRIFKEHEINPAGQIAGCAPMLLQTPIWLALYNGLTVDLDLRHATFIPGWINDLSNPDMITGNFNSPLFKLPLVGYIYGLNILPLLLGVVFFINMRVQMRNQPKPADESQAKMQKMSQYFILVIPLFLYNAPSGLNLYMFASTLGGIFDTWLVRRHLRAEGLLPNQADKEKFIDERK